MVHGQPGLSCGRAGPARVHQRWAREYGPVFTSFGGSQPFVFTDAPELGQAGGPKTCPQTVSNTLNQHNNPLD